MKVKVFILAMLMFFTSCVSSRVFYNTKLTNDENIVKLEKVAIDRYGVLNTKQKVPGVVYKVSGGNVFWSVLFSGTVVVPVILCGWFLWKPIEVIDNKVFTNEPK